MINTYDEASVGRTAVAVIVLGLGARIADLVRRKDGSGQDGGHEDGGGGGDLRELHCCGWCCGRLLVKMLMSVGSVVKY